MVSAMASTSTEFNYANSFTSDALGGDDYIRGRKTGSGREAVIETVLKSLAGDAEVGVILVGEYGVGKTYVARQVMEVIGPKVLVLSLRCSSSASTIDYGALGSILNELGDVSLDNPLVVLRAITRAIKERAKGREVVLFVDNVQDLDDRSAMVIAQLAVEGVATILAACESLTSASAEIIGLWRDGLLRRVDIQPFSEEATAGWLENTLGAPLSASAAKALWNAGGGNPRFLDVVIHEQIQARTLIKRDEVWIVTGVPFVCGKNSKDTVMTAIGAISPEERLVMELLALSGGLSLNLLMDICDVEALDSLQQRGYLTIARQEFAMVRLCNRLMAQVIRAQVPAGRSRELHRLVHNAPEGAGPAVSVEFALATWALDCGIPVDLEQGVTAARAATRAGYPGEALRILESLPRHLSLSALIPETARAQLALGDAPRARSLVFDTELELEQLSLRQWTELMFLRSALARGQQQEMDSKGILYGVKARLDSEAGEVEGSGTAERTSGLADLREDWSMSLVEQQMLDGRYLESIDTLQHLYQHGRSSETRLLAGNWLIQAWILTGRMADALKLAEETEHHFMDGEGARIAFGLTDSALVGAVVTALTAEGLGRNTLWSPTGMFIGARITAFAELADGIVEAYNGRAEKALLHLLPVATQLDQLGELGPCALASAAIAYSYALIGDNDSALEFLNRGKSGVDSASRLVATACSYFQVVATAELASKEKAIVRMYALADEQRTYRTTAVEMVFILAAVRLGSTTGAQRLVTLASRVQGPMGRICEGLGQGLLSNDVVTLIRVAEAAVNVGDDLLSRDVARAALKIASENADRESMRQAQQLIRGGMLKLGHVKVSSEDGQVLTVREQEIAAQAAAGQSNKAIAARMHISVRTVEGHLYQVYSKLQVTSRAELKETIVQ